MNDKFVLTEINNIKTGFLFKNGRAEEIRCYEDNSLIGNIYVGRVSNILKNINAAFVDVEKGLSCYLPLEDYHGDRALRTGDLLTVQITKDRIKSKQPAVSSTIALTGEYVVVHAADNIGVSSKIKDEPKRTLLKECITGALDLFSAGKKCEDIIYGGIVRTKAASVDTELVVEETVKLLCELDEIMHRARYSTGYTCLYRKLPAYVSDIEELGNTDDLEVVTDIMSIADECESACSRVPVIYDDSSISLTALYNLKTILNKALSTRAYLKSGAYLVIEPTEAMTVIDVNSGKAIKGSNAEEIIYKINIEAAREISRQLRLRNLSGIIIVDFISMKSSENNAGLMELLKRLAAEDRVLTTVVDITRLGLVEMTRKKIKKPLHEIFCLDI